MTTPDASFRRALGRATQHRLEFEAANTALRQHLLGMDHLTAAARAEIESKTGIDAGTWEALDDWHREVCPRLQILKVQETAYAALVKIIHDLENGDRVRIVFQEGKLPELAVEGEVEKTRQFEFGNQSFYSVYVAGQNIGSVITEPDGSTHGMPVKDLVRVELIKEPPDVNDIRDVRDIIGGETDAAELAEVIARKAAEIRPMWEALTTTEWEALANTDIPWLAAEDAQGFRAIFVAALTERFKDATQVSDDDSVIVENMLMPMIEYYVNRRIAQERARIVVKLNRAKEDELKLRDSLSPSTSRRRAEAEEAARSYSKAALWVQTGSYDGPTGG